MPTPAQFGAFEPVRIYDAPGVLISNAIEGELTRRGAFATFFDSKALSPRERDTFNTRLKEQAGNNPLVGAAVDVALNPWVWLLFVTSIPGQRALAEGAGAITDVAKKYSAFFRENGGMLQTLGLATPDAALRGTAVSQVAQRVATGVEKLSRAEGKLYAERYTKFLEQQGLPTLDFTSNLLSAEQKVKAKEFAYLLQARLEGWDEVTERTLYSGIIEKENGKLGARFIKETQDPWVTFDVAKRMREVGGQEFVDVADDIRNAFRDRAILTFGKEGAPKGHLVVDEEKVLRIYRGMNSRIIGRAGKGDTPIGRNADGEDFVRALFGDDMREYIQAGALDKDDFVELVKDTFQQQIQANYFPRNLSERITDSFGGRGVSIPGQEARRAARILDPSKSNLARTRLNADYHPDDFDSVREVFKGQVTSQFERAHLASVKKMATAETNGFVPLMHRLNPQEAVSLHFRDTAKTWAWHVQDVGEEVLAAQERVFAGKPQVLEGFSDRFDGFGGKQGASVSEPFRGVSKDRQPLGGFSLADALWGQYVHIKDPYVQHMIPHFIVPSTTGQYTVRQLATEQALMGVKNVFGRMVEGPFGRMLDSVGGQEIRKGLRAWSDPTTGIGGAKPATKWLASYLYVSHLGLNGGSISLNMMQPLLLASTQLGAKNVLKGYKSALGEMVGYLKERVAQGGRFLDEFERREMIQKHFRFANYGDEDLLGIAPDFFQSIDQIAFPQGVGGFNAAEKSNQLFHIFMKGFEKTEWMNRSVTAHAVANAYEAAGRATSGGAFISDVRGMVGRTQFGGSFLNTPLAFQTSDFKLTPFGRIASNPLIRMFLNFPLRSVSEALVYGPKLGGREGFLPLLNDVARGMGVSAITYEATKNLFNADVSRGLFASSLGDAFGGQRFFEGDSIIPVPPVIDIPANIVRGLATGDAQLLKYTLPRTFPGGVAIARALGMAPDLGLPNGINPQRTYVDWDQVQPDGTVPVFKWDGTLIEFKHPSDLVFKSMGLDFGSAGRSGEVDGVILKNLEEMRAARRKATFALLNGDMRKFKAVSDQYKTRFGMPLTIGQSRLESAQTLMTQPRTGRIIDKAPEEVREAFKQLAGEEEKSLQPRHMTEEMRRAISAEANHPNVETPTLPGQNRAFGKFGAFSG